MVQPVLIRPIPCLQHHHGLARNDATRVTGTRSSSACLSTALSVCLYMSICLPAHLSVCLAVNQSRLMPPSACLSTALSVWPSLLPICPPVRLSVYPSICLSVCLPISLPAYVSVRPSAYLSYCPCCLSACLSTGHTGHTMEPRCRVLPGASPSADVPGMIGS